MRVPRLLIVSHDFPPSSGTSGRRPARLCKFLSEHGAPPAVVTAAPEFYGDAVLPGPSMREEVSVYEVRCSCLWAASQMAGGLGGLVGKSALVAAYRGAIERALKSGGRPDFMYFLGVPFWYFPLARYFRGRWGVPYVLEFGDVFYMRGVSYRKGQRSGVRQVLDAVAEAWSIARAALVIHTTEEQTELYRRRYPWKPADEFITIPWGYDADVLRGVRAARRDPGDGFRVAIFGKLAAYSSADAEALARAVAGFHVQRRVEVLHLGDSEPALEAAFRREGLSACFKSLGMQPYLEGLCMLASADCFVLNAISEVSMPVKVYDYLGLNRPILAFVTPGSATGRLLGRFSNAFVVQNAAEAERALRSIAERQLKCLEPRLDTTEFSQQYQFERLLAKLVELSDRCDVSRRRL